MTWEGGEVEDIIVCEGGLILVILSYGAAIAAVEI